jgi:hypothetical protein
VIRDLLDMSETALSSALGAVLADRLDEINHDLRRLREQQRFIVGYLRGDLQLGTVPFLTADRFVELLELAGLNPEKRATWHAAFERASGPEHQVFLEFLCLPDEEIASIRHRSAAAADVIPAPTPPRGRRPDPG